MIKPARSLVLMAAAALALTAACGRSNSSQKALSQVSSIHSAVAQGATAAPSGSAGPGHDPASVDVCALITPADGNSVAQANGLGSFTAEKDDRDIPDSSACKFSFGGADKSVIMEVRAGSFIDEYVLDPKVNGLGDEAYDDGTSPAMRVGDLLVTAEMDSLSDAVTLDLLRKMVPHLR